MKANLTFYCKILLLQVIIGFLLLTSCKDRKDKFLPLAEDNNMYVSTLFDYSPAPGQYINSKAGSIIGANSILKGIGAVNLGTWGGSIILGFDHTVLNHPNKKDIVVHEKSGLFEHPGIIWVMKDENGNGQPDDTWYEIPRSQFEKEDYVPEYSVTYTRSDSLLAPGPWKRGEGDLVVIGRRRRTIYGIDSIPISNKRHYFPEWIEADSYTLTGSLYHTHNSRNSERIEDSNDRDETFYYPNPFDYSRNLRGTYIYYHLYEWDYSGDSENSRTEFDISDAVDKNGNPVNLTGINFVKIQTGIFNGWSGPLHFSTTVMGVADLSMQEK